MKQTVKRITVLTITALFCFAFFIAGFKSERSFAAVVNNSVYYDEFNSESGKLNDDLIPFGGADVKTDYSAMRLNSDKSEWDAHIVNGGYKLEYDKIDSFCTVEFTIRRIDESGSWLGFSFGVSSVSTRFPLSSGALIFYSEKSNLFKQGSNGLQNADGSDLRDFTILHDVKVKASLKFEKIADEEGYYYLTATCSDAETEEILNTHDYGKVYIADGYFGFNSYSMKADIFEFAVYDKNGATEFYDDFTTPAVSYVTGGAENPVWYANSYWNRSNLIVGSIGRLDITKAGSGVVYKEPFENADNKGLNLLYTLSADFHVGEMQNSAESGIIVGADKNGNGGAFIGFTKISTACALVFRNDGKESVRVGNFNDPVINVVANVYYGKKAEVIIDDETYLFDLDSVFGYVGFKTVGGQGAVGAYTDNFSYENSEYVESKSSDSKFNFDEVIEKETVFGIDYDFYCPSKDWYRGERTELPLKVEGDDNGHLDFSSAGEMSCFAPKKKYNDFIIRFDVKFTVVDASKGNLFGIEIGKTMISESFANSVYIGFHNRGEVTYCISNKCLNDEGLNAKPLVSQNGKAENIFIKDETYNVMAIAKNGVVTLHVKNANEPESVLSLVRARFENVNTDGYVAMFAANSLSLQLDNFSVINLDYECFENDNDYNTADEKLQTFRYDFTSGSDFSAITGGTVKKDKTVEISRVSGDVVTKGKVGANITRLRFSEIEGGALYKHGNLAVNVNETQGKITVSDGGENEYTVKLENGFVYKNALFEIEELSGKIYLSFVSGDKPLAAMSDNVYEFKIDNDLTAEKIYISSSGIASIKEMSVFNLDTNVTISSGIYVPQEVRIERTPIQKSGSGCSSATGGGLFVFLALGTVTAVMTAKRRKNNV